jgi:CheY-like chemotaxis protein
MGGQINVQSEPGKGSVFSFSLPLTLTDPPNASVPDAGKMNLEVLKNLKVLIVDDNRINRQILSELLLKWQCRYLEADSADKALDLLKNMPDDDPVRLIITDNQMPEKDGMEFAAQVKNKPEWANIPIIMLSSMTAVKSIRKSTKKIFDAFITKPVRHAALLESILSVLNNSNTVSEERREHSNKSDSPTTVSTIKCLVVEDHPINRKLACSILKKFSCAADIAKNGIEALEKIEHNDYDIVFMDCQMPVMNGYDATRAVRALEEDGTLTSHLPIIAMTANAMSGDREICLEAGMDDYISKPIKKVKIIDALKKYIKQN